MKIDIWVGRGHSGGVESVINNTVKYLHSHGHDIRVIQLIWVGKAWLEQDVDFDYLIEGTLTSWHGVYEKYLLYYKYHNRPDIVLVEGWPILTLFARKLIVESGMGFKVIYRPHNELPSYESIGLGGMDFLKYTDAVIANNLSTERLIRNYDSGINVYRIDNPVNGDNIVFNDKRDIHKLAFVGRIAPVKRVDRIIKTMSRLSDEYKLDIVGDGSEEETIKNMIDEYRLSSRIIMHGWNESPWDLVKNTGGLLIASDSEIGPLVAVEALLCGIPVFSRPVGNMREIIISGINGFLYENDDELLDVIIGIGSDKIPLPTADDCRASVHRFIGDVEIKKIENAMYEVLG